MKILAIVIVVLGMVFEFVVRLAIFTCAIWLIGFMIALFMDILRPLTTSRTAA